MMSGNRKQDHDIEVPISPVKRSIPPLEQRSPGRVLLGIDKGVKGSDVSLRRAHSNRDAPLHTTAKKLPTSRSSASNHAKSGGSLAANTEIKHSKSFSERMAEGRLQDKDQEDRRQANHKNRSSGFKLDQAEFETYKSAVQEDRGHDPSRSLGLQRNGTSFGRDEVLRAYKHPSSSSIVSRNTASLSHLQESGSHNTSSNDSSRTCSDNELKGDTSLYEPYSQIHLSSRVLPHSFLQRTVPSETHTPLRIPQLLKDVTAPSFELPEHIVDYVVFAIVGSKSSPINHKPGTKESNMKGSNDWEKQWEDGSQNDKKFMVLQLTDLKWSIDLYLFGTALPRYHRLSQGTLIAILNPNIMPPKKGKEDTGAFSLTLNSGDDTVLEIGTARDLGYCKAVKKDGKDCGNWVNLEKTDYCDWHLNTQVTKTQAGRMGVNTGSNAFGLGGRGGRGLRNMMPGGRNVGQRSEGRGLLPRKEGRRYDRNTGSQYFIASSSAGQHLRTPAASVYGPGRSTADLLDVDDDDDPFLAEGQLSRDRDSRLRQRLVAEERERVIARNLGAMGSGGAGGEYLRHRKGESANVSGGASEQESHRAVQTTKASIMQSVSRANTNAKRTAEAVRLSPVKKRRLVTSKGVGHGEKISSGVIGRKDDAEDGDLEIV